MTNESPTTPQPTRRNELTIPALVLGIAGLFFFPIILSTGAVIMGHISLAQILRSAGTQRGQGMALAGLILGYLGLGLWLFERLSGIDLFAF